MMEQSCPTLKKSRIATTKLKQIEQWGRILSGKNKVIWKITLHFNLDIFYHVDKQTVDQGNKQ